MKRNLFMLMLMGSSIILTGCSMEDFGFEYTTGTGLTITKENYEKIEDGSTYEEVKEILGGACDNYYSDDDEDWYTCIDDKDSAKRIVLKVVKGKAEHKSSSGLN